MNKICAPVYAAMRFEDSWGFKLFKSMCFFIKMFTVMESTPFVESLLYFQFELYIHSYPNKNSNRYVQNAKINKFIVTKDVEVFSINRVR